MTLLKRIAIVCAFVCALASMDALGQVAVHSNTAQDATGKRIPQPTVKVCAYDPANPSSCASASTIYSDRNLTALGNPFFGDAQGNFEFWAMPGDYTVQISRVGFAAYTYHSTVELSLSGTNGFTGVNLFESINGMSGVTANSAGADICEKIANKIATGGYVINAVALTGDGMTATCAANPFVAATHPVRLEFGSGTVTTLQTWTPPSGSIITSLQGVSQYPSLSRPQNGFTLKLDSSAVAGVNGVTNPPAVIKLFGVSGVTIENVNIDANKVSGAACLWEDSVSNPSSANNTFKDSQCKNFHLGYIAGDPSTASEPNAAASWGANTAFVLNSYMDPGQITLLSGAKTHFVYQATTVVGNSGGSAPDWTVTSAIGQTVTDGGVTWTAQYTSNSYQSDHNRISNVQFANDGSDLTAEAIFINSDNAFDAGHIERVKFLSVNKGIHIRKGGSYMSIERTDPGSGVGSNPAFFQFDNTATPNRTAVGPSLRENHTEGTGWTYSVHDSICNSSYIRPATWVGNQWGHQILVDGCDQVISQANAGSGSPAGYPLLQWVVSGTSTIWSAADTWYAGTNPPWTISGSAKVGYLNPNTAAQVDSLVLTASTNQITGTNTLQLHIDGAVGTAAEVSINRLGSTGGFAVYKGNTGTRNFFMPDSGAGTFNVSLSGPTLLTGALRPITAATGTVGSSLLPFADYYTGNAVSQAFHWDVSALTGVHAVKVQNVDGTMPLIIASGTSAMGTGAITTGTCATVVTTTATNAAATDTIAWAFNAAPGTGWAGLHVEPYVSAGNVNFLVCNATAGSLTPAAATINWRVIR